MPETAATLNGIVDAQALVVIGGVKKLRTDLPGSVHDARVGVRKLRSTLVVFRPMLRRTSTSLLAGDLRWFARQLSQARDAQVVRERVSTALAVEDAPAALRHELLAALDRRSAPVWSRAETAIHDQRVELLLARLEQARCHGLARRRSARGSLTDRIGAELHELLDSAAATCAGPADHDRVHDLRKQVKRVRFAVASQRHDPGARQVSRALEDLQDRLGAYQDAVVTAGHLEDVGASFAETGSEAESAAVSVLALRIAERQRQTACAARDALPDDVARLRRAVGMLHP